jgi:hypothetical protein
MFVNTAMGCRDEGERLGWTGEKENTGFSTQTFPVPGE